MHKRPTSRQMRDTLGLGDEDTHGPSRVVQGSAPSSPVQDATLMLLGVAMGLTVALGAVIGFT